MKQRLGPLIIQLVWYILKQLFTSVSVKVMDIYWLSHHGIRAIFTPYSTNMASERVSFEVFLLLLYFSFLYFEDVFNHTIIPLTLVRYEMIIATRLVDYLTCARGIIVNYIRLHIYIHSHPLRSCFAYQFAFVTRGPYCHGRPKKLCFTTLSLAPTVLTARLCVVKQSFFGLPPCDKGE